MPPRGHGTGAGNCPVEAFIAVAISWDWRHNCDLFALAGRRRRPSLRPLQDRPVRSIYFCSGNRHRNADAVYSGVYSSRGAPDFRVEGASVAEGLAWLQPARRASCLLCAVRVNVEGTGRGVVDRLPPLNPAMSSGLNWEMTHSCRDADSDRR